MLRVIIKEEHKMSLAKKVINKLNESIISEDAIQYYGVSFKGSKTLLSPSDIIESSTGRIDVLVKRVQSLDIQKIICKDSDGKEVSMYPVKHNVSEKPWTVSFVIPDKI